MRISHALPLPRFVLHPFTAVVIAAVHVYLGVGHLSKLFGGDLQWTHFWKGFGALAGAYVFAALASRRLARYPDMKVGTLARALMGRGKSARLECDQYDERLEGVSPGRGDVM